jgi:hypothetical protein
MEVSTQLAIADLQKSQAELESQLKNGFYVHETNTEVDITNMRKEAVVEALFNGTAPCGMGYIANAADGQGKKYTRESAREDLLSIIKRRDTMYFDYLHGKRMKLHIGRDVVDIRRYNSGANKEGLGQSILVDLKKDPSAFYLSSAEMRADPIWQYCHPNEMKSIINYFCTALIFTSILFAIFSL